MNVLSLNEHRTMAHWIENFLVAEEAHVTPATWIHYSQTLELWRIFLDSYFGQICLKDFMWEHIEGFLAYWYFRYFLEHSLEQALVLMITLENFHCWLTEQEIVQKPIWQEVAGQTLKWDLNRSLCFRNGRKPLEKKTRLACDAGWYVIDKLEGRYAQIIGLHNHKCFYSLLSDGMMKFLLEGDVFMGSVWQGKGRKTFFDEYSIRTLYPRAARKYFREDWF